MSSSTPLPALPAAKHAALILRPHLSRLYRAVGREVVQLCFAASSDISVLQQLTNSPAHLRETVSRALAATPPAQPTPPAAPSSPALARDYRISPTTEAILLLLDRQVRDAPALDGILLEECVSLVHTQLGVQRKAHSLLVLIDRTKRHHNLMVRQGRVRMTSSVLKEVIAARHAAHMLQFPKPQPRELVKRRR